MTDYHKLAGEIQGLMEKATPGPWVVAPVKDNGGRTYPTSYQTWAFIEPHVAGAWANEGKDLGDLELIALLRNNCDAIVRALKEVPRWQPIETAPKDGTEFIAFFPKYKYHNGGTHHAYVGPSHWSVGDRLNGPHWTEGAIKGQPTHWMPLPAPPQEPQS